MPSTITKYKIFLASPSDVQDERASIDEVINELNLTFGKQQDIHLELLKWETHSAPAIAINHPQEIINSDLGKDYDLFIGLIWKKFGTPTNEADSGTEEEFLNAYNRFIETPNSLQILFYFNCKPVSITEMNPEQLLKIQNFKTDIGKNKKVLYWEYQDTQQLSKFLRIHIPQRILELRKNEQNKVALVETKEVLEVDILKEEYGIIDYQEMIEDNIRESTESLTRISDATEWIGNQLNKKTAEMNAMTANGNQPGRKTLKNYFIRTAKVMDNYANRIEPEIPIFHEYFEKGIDALSNVINISRNDLNVEQEEIDETNESLSSLINGITSSIESMDGFLQSVNDLPRMSKELNKAKSNVGMKLEDLLDNLRVSLSIAIELKKSLLE
ncbi:DUF4062 domain-containing protein [Thalassobellus sediminis]|uniref:DUF4062 domain-containing protein n=1 Tax=Thalassobellus sediminis TaxID=3367753 RepID=UPI0037A9643E